MTSLLWPSTAPIIDTDALAAQLLDEGAASFVKSWNDLMECISSKRAAPKAA
jgi:transaldolase